MSLVSGLVALHGPMAQRWLSRRAKNCCTESCMQSWILLSMVTTGRGGTGCGTGVLRGWGTSPVRALRYGVDNSAVCNWGSVVEVRGSGGGCATVLLVPPLTLSFAFRFSSKSFGQSRDQASCSPPQAHLGLAALHVDDLCSVEEHRPHRSLPLQELAMCPYAWHLKHRMGFPVRRVGRG